MYASLASSKFTAEPSDLVGAAPKPLNITSSSNARSEDSVVKISACWFSYLSYSIPNKALRPGSNSFASCARDIAISQSPYTPVVETVPPAIAPFGELKELFKRTINGIPAAAKSWFSGSS